MVTKKVFLWVLSAFALLGLTIPTVTSAGYINKCDFRPKHILEHFSGQYSRTLRYNLTKSYSPPPPEVASLFQ